MPEQKQTGSLVPLNNRPYKIYSGVSKLKFFMPLSLSLSETSCLLRLIKESYHIYIYIYVYIMSSNGVLEGPGQYATSLEGKKAMVEDSDLKDLRPPLAS